MSISRSRLASDARGEDQEIGLGRDPENADGEHRGHGRGQPEAATRAGRDAGIQRSDAVTRRDVPRDEDRDLRHDGIGEAERGREVRELFDRIGDETGVLEASKAIGTGPNMRLEGGNAKTLLVIEEEVDLSREKMTVIHGEVYALAQEWVSGNKTEILAKIGPLEQREATHISHTSKWNFLRRWSFGPSLRFSGAPARA